MCYDISFHSSLESISSYLPEVEYFSSLPLSFESVFHIQGHAYLQHPVIINEDGKLKMVPFEWGVVAGYMNTLEKIRKMRPLMLNARSEKLMEKSSYWNKIIGSRCLVPMNGFFEHQDVPGIKNKVPYHIRIKGEKLLFVAGLYAYAPHPETGEAIGTFCVLTRAANALMQKIHNHGPNKGRMPLILDYTMIRNWLNPNLTGAEIQAILDFEMPPARMEAWPVKQIRGKSKPNDASILERMRYDGLEAVCDE
ncbi:MAG: SOS response-associated peptidase family protein [Bacteroidota bacterium]